MAGARWATVFVVCLSVIATATTFWFSSQKQQQLTLDLSQSEAYEHSLSVEARKSSDRHRRQAYPVFSPGEGGLTIEAQRDSGPWGPWEIQKPCSRTCGGGVQIENRVCLGSGCIGPQKRYVSCETQACPDDDPDFRDAQCAKFENKPLQGVYYKWKAYNRGSNKCELLCMPEGENFYYKWMDKVIDGTKCEPMSEDICVEGFCLPLGCDNMLGSTMKSDKCLVCGGDGTSCKTMQGLFDRSLDAGYHDIITIPVGATSVLIQQKIPSNSYLTIRNESGHYFLNGNKKIDFPQTLLVARAFFDYERTRLNGLSVEKLWARGPVLEAITIGVLHDFGATGIQYEYSIKLDESLPHTYIVDDWSQCSVSCGQGVQTRQATCVDSLTKALVAEDLCVNASLPDLNRTCSAEDCEANWYIGEWEDCSTTCGSHGVQYRVTFCHVARGDGSKTALKDSQCPTERPAIKQSCNRFQCPEWNAGPWSSCSKPCGKAEQYRSVTCRSQKEDENLKLLAAKACNETLKPYDERECNLGPCEGLHWVTSEWTMCDRCNDTTETRNVTCLDQTQRPFPDDKCPGERPIDTRECATAPPCVYKWQASQWSECSTQCGHGHQTRYAYCTYEYRSQLEIVDDSHCDPNIKPTLRQNCTNEDNCTGVYYATAWSKCTAECGGGTQTRTIVCLDYDLKVREGMCDELKEPATVQDCNIDRCLECNETTFGCCPDNTTAAKGPFFEGCSNCSLSDFGCCPDNVTIATGENFEGCSDDDEGSGSGLNMTMADLTNCSSTFGCCSDGFTAMNDTLGTNCLCNFTNDDGLTVELPCVNLNMTSKMNDSVLEILSMFNVTEDRNASVHCLRTEFGCCPDWNTPAAGPNYADCSSVDLGDCDNTTFGCCPDGLTLARAPLFAGCGDEQCSASRFGCCKDRRTIAFGPYYKGCERSTLTCETGPYGCCADGETTALGPNGKGCEEDCLLSKYGCCPDGTMAAKGPGNQGCACGFSQYGCCPDGKTAAAGHNFQGCPQTCAQARFGCCPDGKTEATGAEFEGCACRFTKYGCCQDGETPARGPNKETCDDCRYAKWGCCLDGVSRATGPNQSGCLNTPAPPTPEPPPISPEDIAACTLPSSVGELCTSYVLKWHYDASSGACRQFWYGGCGGNNNRYETEDQCRRTCIEPPGDNLCYLPKIEGPEACQQTLVRYYYDRSVLQCVPFYFFGCNANANNFEHYDICMERCQHVSHVTEQPPPTPPPHTPYPEETPAPTDVCQLPPDTGPCQALLPRYYYDRTTRQCTLFYYGGCQGNGNQFATKEACQHYCLRDEPAPYPEQDVCTLPADRGTCGGRIDSFYYDERTRACLPFVFTGCGGNGNRFQNRAQCEAKCMRVTETDADVCSLPKDTGPCHDFTKFWFFNVTDGTCTRFYYGGCHGNSNRFKTMENCIDKCFHTIDPCTLPVVVGPCSVKRQRFYFDSNSRSCKQFMYGCLGNANNFQTEYDCNQRCLPYDPRARTGVISASYDQAQQQSVHNVPNLVQSEIEGVCSLPLVQGPCHALLPRYYFDPITGKCLTFTYGGCKGNGNRFKTLEECQTTCELARPSLNDETDVDIETQSLLETLRQVETPLPSVIETTTTQSESTTDLVTSAVSTAATTPAVTDFIDICILPPEAGPCDQRVQRWYFDITRLRCRQFIYGGCVGNHNNFGSEQECQTYCGHRMAVPHQGRLEKPTQIGQEPQRPAQVLGHESPVSPNPVVAGSRRGSNQAMIQPLPRSQVPELCRQPRDIGNCYGDILHFYYDWEKNKCSSLSYTGCGGNSNRFQSEESCQRACGLYRDQDVCLLAYDEGPCTSNVLKWYYDAPSKRCLRFAYGGCEGNGNRFSSKEECASLCGQETLSHKINPCQQPVEVGPCRNMAERYYFNKYIGKCEKFNYGGCQGNDNNFPSNEACEQACITHIASTVKPNVVVVDDACKLNRDSGPCTEMIAQYYFDSTDGECKRFTYGGCRGNANRFNDRVECESRCKQQDKAASLIKMQQPPVVQMQHTRTRDGHNMALHCRTNSQDQLPAEADDKVTWFRDGQRLEASNVEASRVQFFPNGSIKFYNVKQSDGGSYSCAFAHSRGVMSNPITVQIHLDVNGNGHARLKCEKDSGVTDCQKVLADNLCRHKYYGPACCKTCARSRNVRKSPRERRRLRPHH